jgi:hypothetical protein
MSGSANFAHSLVFLLPHYHQNGLSHSSLVEESYMLTDVL